MAAIQAVIFDMDGVLADTEPLWRKAMISGFVNAGIGFTEDDCRKTTGMRFDEVVDFWYRTHRFANKTRQELHDEIIHDLCGLIADGNVELAGVEEALSLCTELGLKTGLATSSNFKIIECVLKKINKQDFFHAIESAEGLSYGKPHPQVFLNCAHSLGADPAHCLVVEDSLNGVIAAKAARMQVVAVPDPAHAEDPRFCIADHKLNSLPGFRDFFLANFYTSRLYPNNSQRT